MPSLSKFLGGGGTPIGSLSSFLGIGINQTINGSEYLRSGSLKSITGYSALLSIAPGLCVNAVTQPNNTASSVNASSTMRFAGSTYYVLGSAAGAPYASTSLTGVWGATSVDVSSSCNDAFAFGSQLIHVTGTVGTVYRLSGTAGTSIAVLGSATYNSGAVNAAGTLGVVAASSVATDGQIYSSTNGATWTSRTPSGGLSENLFFAVWQPLTSTFAYLTQTGRINTTADGFTLTNQGIPTSLGSTSQAVGAASSFSAANSTATLFSVKATYDGLANQMVLLRSTNGTTFTATLWSTLLGVTPTQAPKVSEQGGVFTAIVPGVTGRLNDDLLSWQSTDGSTWTPLPVPVNTAQGITATITEFRYLNGSWTVLPSASQTNPPFTLTGLAATHVGMPIAQTQTNAANVVTTSYVRIK